MPFVVLAVLFIVVPLVLLFLMLIVLGVVRAIKRKTSEV
jgi:hypothetical protein